jgi:hypothetical protein
VAAGLYGGGGSIMSESEAESNQLDKFGGIIDLNLKIRIPYCFYKAVKEYCDLTNTPIRRWFNDEIILAIESIELDYVSDTFIKKYHLHEPRKERGNDPGSE